MLKRSVNILFLFSLSFIVIFVLATDDQNNPNDPTINERANACYSDGSMANKCDTHWEWECGWYLIRFEHGLISRDNFPTQCASLLPPVITSTESPEAESSNTPDYGVCPSLSLSCSTLFDCNEAFACYQAGNTSLDTDNDKIPCNEAGNLLLGVTACTQ